jgi:hypothetical protein
MGSTLLSCCHTLLQARRLPDLGMDYCRRSSPNPKGAFPTDQSVQQAQGCIARSFPAKLDGNESTQAIYLY